MSSDSSYKTDWLLRSRMLLGEDCMERLHKARVIIFGVGGVGSWCAESLVRSGLGNLAIVDFDKVTLSNINRQDPALASTVGQDKVDAMAERLVAINPQLNLLKFNRRVTKENLAEFELDTYDFLIDAIDSVSDKAALLLETNRIKTLTVFSSMGAARRLDPTQVRAERFDRVQGCALARALRQKFKAIGLRSLPRFKCAYSLEQPMENVAIDPEETANGSLCTVTAAFGLTLASLVLKAIKEGAK